MKRRDSFVGDSISSDASELCGERQHGAQHLAQWRDVILRDPAPQLHEVGRECRRYIEDLAYSPSLEIRFAIVQLCDDSAHALLAERHDDTAADNRLRRIFRDTV